MNDINHTTALGRLIHDSEVRYASTGTAVASFDIAANRHYRDKAGQWQQEVAFIPCVAFGRVAEQMASCIKGAPLLVTGRLKTETWTKNGANQSKLVLVAETVHAVQPMSKPKADGELSQPLPDAEELRKAVPF